MRIAVLFGPLCLSFRKQFDFDTLRTDQRGLTGSEIGFVRICEELHARGHNVTVLTEAQQSTWHGMRVAPLAQKLAWGHAFDVAIAINEPDLLAGMKADVRVCEAWLNDFTFCAPGFDEHVDLFVSPSAPHREQALNNPAWRVYGVNGQHPKGQGSYEPDASKWVVNHLGCDPERYDSTKVSGRVIYCSSPDRGLHLLLEQWPHIKRAVPHATLRIFYRLREWIEGFANVRYSPPIEKLRQRALYIAECLHRLSGPEWGITVCDSVSREQIEREMAEARVLAYPTSTVSWSEGFSCSTLEACAACACPVILDCDALGDIYRNHCIIEQDILGWRHEVVRCLTDDTYRERWNARAHAFALENTWKAHVDRLETEIQARRAEKMTLREIRLVGE